MTTRVGVATAAIVGLIISAVAGCAAGPPMTEDEIFDAETCAAFDPSVVSLQMEPRVARPGDALTITAGSQPAPWSYDRVRSACFDRWTLSDPAAGTWSSDHGTLTLAEAVLPGTLTVTARLNGANVVLPIVIVAKDAVVLTGLWSEASITCEDGFQPSEPVRELVLLADGSWSATYTPFEARRDFWGQAAFDPATKALSLAVESGNSVPVHLSLDGTATIGADGKLILDGFWFGDAGDPRATKRSCRYVFDLRG